MLLLGMETDHLSTTPPGNMYPRPFIFFSMPFLCPNILDDALFISYFVVLFSLKNKFHESRDLGLCSWPPVSLTVPSPQLCSASVCWINEWGKKWINNIFLRQKRNSPQRSVGPLSQAPDSKSDEFLIPPSCISAVETPRLYQPASASANGITCFSSVHLFSSNPWVFTFLDMNLACVFEFQFFSFATEWGRCQWHFARLLYPLRDFGLYLGSLPTASVSTHIFTRFSGGLSPTFPSRNMWARAYPLLISNWSLPQWYPLAGWLQEAPLGSGKVWILDSQWRLLQSPRMSRGAVFWQSSQVGDRGDTVPLRHRWDPGVACTAGLILEGLMSSPAGAGHSPWALLHPSGTAEDLSSDGVGTVQGLHAPSEDVSEILTI